MYPLSGRLPDGLRLRVEKIGSAYRSWATPREDSLPRARVLFALPVLLVLFGAVMIGLTINGTSSGAFYADIHEGKDPALLLNSPERIRSDEWNVGTTWTISQLQQGLPEVNRAFPGGMDAAIPQDLPRRDWSIAFRPQLIGYLVLDADHGTAARWWIPFLSLLAAAYMFSVTVLPRRPLTSAALALGFAASPFFTWWFQSSTFWPAVWGLAAMSALIWAARSTSRAARWGWAAATGYLTVVMAMGIYAPYIVPVIVVVAFFGVAVLVALLTRTRHARSLLRLAPILVAGAVGGAITAVWLQSKQSVVAAFLNTDYPGDRTTQPGGGSGLGLARLISSPFSEALQRANGFLGLNSSEASTFFLAGAFLMPVLIWLVVRRVRSRSGAPWELIGLAASLVLLAAFIFVPGWGGLAHLLFLDRTTEVRLRIGLGVGAFAILPLLIAELENDRLRAGRALSWVVAALFLLPEVAVAVAFIHQFGLSRLAHDAPFWWAYAIVSAAALFWFARRRVAAAAIAYLLVNLVVTLSVNPAYLGVLDLRKTAVSKAIMSVGDGESWVGVGSSLPTAMLLESGVQAYNGVQGAPSRTMWKQIDPAGTYRYEWNRLGNVSWTPGSGNPVVSNPAPDIILSTFDACASFAQNHVGHVLADVPLSSPCLTTVRSFHLPKSVVTLYDVVPKP